MRPARSLLCLVLAAFFGFVVSEARGVETAPDWQTRIDRVLGKMREEAARLHEEGDKLWNTGYRRGSEEGKLWNTDYRRENEDRKSVEESDERARVRERQKKEPPPQHDAEEHSPPKDDAGSILQIVRAAEQGDARAQCLLGTMYATGQGVPKDDVKAVRFYEEAAEQKNADAQYALGWMYAHGRGVPRDEAKAVQWCLKAAEQGIVAHVSCQNFRRAAK